MIFKNNIKIQKNIKAQSKLIVLIFFFFSLLLLQHCLFPFLSCGWTVKGITLPHFSVCSRFPSPSFKKKKKKKKNPFLNSHPAPRKFTLCTFFILCLPRTCTLLGPFRLYMYCHYLLDGMIVYISKIITN